MLGTSLDTARPASTSKQYNKLSGIPLCMAFCMLIHAYTVESVSLGIPHVEASVSA